MLTEEIRARLFAEQDLEYKAFQSKLMPTVDPARIIGVRTPILRKLAKEYSREPRIEDFLSDLPHAYYDENNLHGFIISLEKDFDAAVCRANELLPYVDNWATCDLLSPKVFAKNKEKLKPEIDRWLSSGEVYTIRFGIEMTMAHFLDADFDPLLMQGISEIRSGEYYVNMMLAWYFATALAKKWDAALPYIKEHRLSPWVHNKTIQKAVESYRITQEQKEYLHGLKIK